MEKLFSLTLSEDDLVFVCNAINETLEALEEWEFQTRTGVTRDEAQRILRELHQILDRPAPPLHDGTG